MNATLSGTCGAVCVQQDFGVLKICKIAGPGITTGAPFSFTTGWNKVSSTVTVPAGGCALGPSFPAGSTVTVTENIPQGSSTTVAGISINGLKSFPGSTISGNSITFPMSSGVAEVTYTNQAPTGYLEICKQQEPPPNGTNLNPALGNSTFTVSPGNSGPIVVAAGACSPAVEVPAVTVTIQETPTPSATMTSCVTIPASQLASCILAPGIAKVKIGAGGISTQTIAIITNKANPINPNGGGGGGNGNGNNSNK